MTMATQIFRTRESDPMLAANRLHRPGESLLACRGHEEGSTARGPAVRIMHDNQVRVLVVSQRDSVLGYDD